MPKIAITIEYDGTAYAGWQRQDNALTVQQAVECAVEKITGQYTPVTGSGRTDAGVHATGQVAHFTSENGMPPDKWAYAINAQLPEDIRIKASREVGEAFHARKSAKAKRYEYHILNAQFPSAINRNTCWHVYWDLDTEKMKLAIKDIEGCHDFAAFRSTGDSVIDTCRTIFDAWVKPRGEYIVVSIRGDGFLYNMVRIITGTLVEIGQGKSDADSFRKAINSGERNDLGITAPAKGLFLADVEY